MTDIDLVVGHHLNTYRSGVARFNAILARGLGVEFVSLWDGWEQRAQRPLLSFKADELEPEERERVGALLSGLSDDRAVRAFFHVWNDTGLEQELARRSEVAYCGNHAVLAAVEPLARRAELLWSPGTISDCRPYEPAEVSVFSFGMAHKLRTDEYERLRALLDGLDKSYALYFSNANHESATMRDAELLYEEMRRTFPRGLYFLGNLSDVAVYNHLVGCTYFAAFFPEGVRANNSTVVSAMEHGAVVITNLDEHSPDYLVHMQNLIDINRCDALPADPLELKRISVRAMETAKELSWDRLLERLR